MSPELLTIKAERQKLIRRIGRRTTAFEGNPDPELYAMLEAIWNKRYPVAQRMRPHLRRMIAAEFVFVTNTADHPNFAEAWLATRRVATDDILAYEDSGDNLENLKPSHRTALADVFELQARQLE